MTGTESVEVLQRKVGHLMRLTEISAGLSSTLTIKPLLSTIMAAATEVAEAEAASVLLWEAKTQELRFAATTTPTGRSYVGMRVPLDSSIAGAVMLQNEAVRVDDVRSDPRHYSRIDQQTDFETRSILGVPMRSKNRVIGVLEAINRHKLPWTDDDVNYLTILASQAATAIEVAQLVTQLQKANDELNQLDKLKSDFIAIASHELRTPLGVILGYASFLQETDDEEVRSHADKVVNSALQLRRIIEDLTNLRYMEQGTAELNPEPLMLGALLRDVLAEQRDDIAKRRHTVRMVPPEPAIIIHADRIRIGMAITNVLKNAIRFTPDGGTITVTTTAPNDREVRVIIEDNGAGIPPDKLEHIFTRFIQLEDHMTRHNGGLGIGLSIARALVEAHNGRIWAESRGKGQGASFIFSLPRA
jgi:signal transduction histidine kinase